MPRTNTKRKRNGKKKKRGRPPKKKTRQKKTTKRASRKTKYNKNAPKENFFVLCDGKQVRSVKELADVMEDIEKHVFEHHVTPDSNDFAKWVEDIFKDVELAKKLAGVKEKGRMQLVLYKHITHKLW